MLSIAITGGIGSGKTETADYLRSLGYTVIDADAISKEMTSKGGKALPLIRERFGDSLFKEDGTLDRAAVREMIFTDPEKKAAYEACTTKLVLDDIAEKKELSERIGEEVIFYDIPLLYETGTEDQYDAVWVVTADKEIRMKRIMERDGKNSKDKALFFDIPLLFETGSEKDYDAVWVVTADYEVRKNRVMARDGIQPSIIDLIMDSQEGEARKVLLADFVLYNNGTLDELRDAVDRALEEYGLQD